jgi:hypothetical protein
MSPEVSFLTPAELDHRKPSALATGWGELDRLLGGGVPRGRITELCGEQGGSTALYLLLAGRLTQQGHLVALVDGAGSLDPRTALAASVALERLFWVRPTGWRAAVRAADSLLRSTVFTLLILDLPTLKPALSSAEGRPGARKDGVPLATWVRLAHSAEAHRTAMLLRVARPEGGAGFCATASLALRRSRSRFTGRGAGRTFEGFSAEVALARNKLGLPGGQVELSWSAPDLFPTPPPQ